MPVYLRMLLIGTIKNDSSGGKDIDHKSVGMCSSEIMNGMYDVYGFYSGSHT